MKILITGSHGRLGSSLLTRLQDQHDVHGIDIDSLDVTNSLAVMEFMQQHQSELVIHAAAWTDVDGCAKDPLKALNINGYGTKNLAIACQHTGCAMLYVSSNEVFDGTNPKTVLEYDPTNPANPYGYSKWVGEQAVTHHLQRFYIVRTSWLFAHGGKNFIQAIYQRAKDGQPLRVVVNEVAAPTHNDDLAEAIVNLIATHQYGIYHLVNEGRASRWAFARQILDMAGFDEYEIAKISAAEYPRASTPPEYSVLENTAAAALGIRLRPWQDALQAFLAKEGWLS